MNSKLKIILKIALILAFFSITPFFSGISENMKQNKTPFLQGILDQTWDAENFSIKEQLALIPDFDAVLAKVEKETPIVAPKVPNAPSSVKKKSIYLYNTHQSESFADNITIFEIGATLAAKLTNEGFDVTFEKNNFLKEADARGLKYNELYSVSRNYINDAFASHGEYDLVIDLHRDSLPKDLSTLQANGKSYAKMMFVVGMKSNNADVIMERCKTLTDKINAVQPGIMRAVFERQSVYNQDMHENMVLLEVGGDFNTSEEVYNSINVLVEMLKKGDWE